MCKWKLCNLMQSILICGMLAVPQLSAQLKTTQAQHLVDLTAQRHPEITGLELSVNHGQEGCVTIAATQAKDLGEKCDDDEAAALKTLKPFVEHEPDGFDVTAPLHNARGNLIGTLGIDFKPQARQTNASILKLTSGLLREIEQKIPSKEFLSARVTRD